jgi:hypothetical protein
MAVFMTCIKEGQQTSGHTYVFQDTLIKIYTSSIEFYIFSGLKIMAPSQILRLMQRIQVDKCNSIACIGTFLGEPRVPGR